METGWRATFAWVAQTQHRQILPMLVVKCDIPRSWKQTWQSSVGKKRHDERTKSCIGQALTRTVQATPTSCKIPRPTRPRFTMTSSRFILKMSLSLRPMTANLDEETVCKHPTSTKESLADIDQVNGLRNLLRVIWSVTKKCNFGTTRVKATAFARIFLVRGIIFYSKKSAQAQIGSSTNSTVSHTMRYSRLWLLPFCQIDISLLFSNQKIYQRQK